MPDTDESGSKQNAWSQEMNRCETGRNPKCKAPAGSEIKKRAMYMGGYAEFSEILINIRPSRKGINILKNEGLYDYVYQMELPVITLKDV